MKEGWEYKKLGEVCDRITDGSHNPPKGISSSNYLMISSQNVFNDRIILNDVRYLSKDDFLKEDKRTHIKPNDVLLTIVGTIGRCAVVKEEIGNVTLQRSVAVLSPSDSINSRYLMYCCIGNNDNLNKNAHGVAQRGIYLKQLEKVAIPVPSLSDQHQIVSELDLLSGAIEKQKAQLVELDKLAQSIFYDMFGDKKWEYKSLKEITFKMGSGATPRGGNQSYKLSGVSLIRSLNVHNNCFIYGDLAYIDEEQAKQLNNVVVEIGDVLLNITGASVARCCMVPDDVLPARVNQHVCIIRPISQINNVFLCHFLISKDTQTDLLNLSRNNAATREALPKGLLEKFRVPLPPLALQQEFASKIEAIESMKAKVRQSLSEAETLFNSRMDYYFN